ncbi:hypothetical protein TREMEDRAFT_39376 [Tremella mesenterica DSM 1558]|uniref:uncharacterized protein n=1 Tax=Tremella mesenterica (strain ATCC 24925 / CBS 8224 / DSM 1558 / NBRC 9311 / NRRL Y-6157 / RJB 2259-6 / UBC 559-6) TaxID=578456 RepID=UPI0003F49104|nr:uncharacterized protein TREMEDRAFT_39376 [Tremella mesenterica DSM 1558]EIW69089.1 hypothetical protein TREMEDRAFT_39376 [Tremella mesenterica DSM 1558]
MSLTSYQHGLQKASDTANKAISVEASLAKLPPTCSPLPTLLKSFPLYISAAQSYSHLLSSGLVPSSDVSAVKKKWRLVLERAEKIKRRVEELGGQVGKASVGDEGEEKAVLRRGRKINSYEFEEWVEPSSREFDIGEEGRWKGDELALPHREGPVDWLESTNLSWTGFEEKMRRRGQGRCVVRQGIGADCSIAAALTVCLEHNCRWGTKLGAGNLWPKDVNGSPVQSQNGKHVLKLMLNGCWRSVILDSLLPHDMSTGTPLYSLPYLLDSTSSTDLTSNTGQAWIPLVSKGLLMSLGGYDIRGSNPSLDLYSLTGWVPERISLRQGFQREKEWNRVYKAWERGKVLVTLGTGSETNQTLISLHAYARILEIFDPGIQETSQHDIESRIADLKLEPRCIFTMTWDQVCTSFDELDLNWNHTLLPVTTIRHWAWSTPTSPEASSGKAPLATLNSLYHLNYTTPPGSLEIWLLLSQHTVSKDRILDDIALHIFDHHSTPPSKASCLTRVDTETQTPYSNNLHILVKHRLRRCSGTLLIIPSRDRGIFQTSFTLRVFAPPSSTLSLERISQSLPFDQTIENTLTSRTAGGNPGQPTYMFNPQYSLQISEDSFRKKGVLRVSVRGGKEIAWNVSIVWGKGERVFELEPKSVLVGSGPYTYGAAYCQMEDIQLGTYTLVVSTFEPGQLGSYRLSVDSDLPVKLSNVALEGAGMFSRTVVGQWTQATAGGRPSGGKYDLNPQIELILPSPTMIMARLYLPTPSPTPLNLTIFRRATGSALGEEIVTTGPYSDAPSGVKINRVKLDAGVYIAVPSTYTSWEGCWKCLLWADVGFTAELRR